MSDIQFDDSTKEFGPPPGDSGDAKKDLTDKFIAWGLAKDRKQAQMVMVGIVAVVWALIAIIYFTWL